MIRVVILGVLALVLHALIAALSVSFGSSGLPIAPAVVLVAYAALAEPPVEASISASVLGLLLDALTGAPLGLNMLACLAALGLARPLASKVSSPRSWSAFLFAAGLSAGYSIFIRVLLSVFAGENFGFQGVFTTALTSGLLALMVFPWLSAFMVRFGLEDRDESLSEKLGQRTRRAPVGHEE